MSEKRRNKRKKERDIKNGKGRFVGLEFNLDGIPKDELKNLTIGTRFNGRAIEAIIKTDKRTIETNSVKGYRRETKPGFILKKTTMISNSSEMGVSANLQNFDFIYGIDTNSKLINNELVHIGVAAKIDMRQMNFEITNIFDLYGIVEKPENHNWRSLIQTLMNHADFSFTSRYAIVIDSDLGNVPSYNKREKAIIDEFILPKNFQLIYSSADTKNDDISNQLIAFCDKYASIALTKVEETCK